MQPARLSLALCLLVIFWVWETWRPLVHCRVGRVRHAVRNLTIAITNAVILGIVFGTATIVVLEWTKRHAYGLLNGLQLTGIVRLVFALVLIDAWMYVWHRANHTIPLLWRFHRTHHSDPQVDVTSAARFHLGEQIMAVTLRLGLIVILGLRMGDVLMYGLLVIAMTHFHHANISLGHFDKWLRLLVVTPDMHRVHHSRLQVETDSNFSTVLSIWDRIAASFRLPENPDWIEFGLPELCDDRWQSVAGMWKTPFSHLGVDRREEKVKDSASQIEFNDH